MSLRQAWFAGWKAAKLHSAQCESAFAAARLEGDVLKWARVPEPPNPYPESADNDPDQMLNDGRPS